MEKKVILGLKIIPALFVAILYKVKKKLFSNFWVESRKKKIQKVIVISKLQFFKQNYTRDCKNYHLFFGIDGGKFLGQGLGPKWLFSDKTRSKRM